MKQFVLKFAISGKGDINNAAPLNAVQRYGPGCSEVIRAVLTQIITDLDI